MKIKAKILTDAQELFLKNAGGNEYLRQNFYLTGGTALAGFYLHHRFSEDLDLFSEQEIDILPLDVFIKEIGKVLQVKKFDYQSSYNRNLFFLTLKDASVLKIEFTHFPFPRIERGPTESGVIIDSILDIAVNKLFTIYQRTNARDYIDLFAICKNKGFTLPDLIKKARLKFDWHIDSLQLGTQFLKAREASDYPKMIDRLEPGEWRAFFEAEAKKLKPQIIDK